MREMCFFPKGSCCGQALGAGAGQVLRVPRGLMSGCRPGGPYWTDLAPNPRPWGIDQAGAPAGQLTRQNSQRFWGVDLMEGCQQWGPLCPALSELLRLFHHPDARS